MTSIYLYHASGGTETLTSPLSGLTLSAGDSATITSGATATNVTVRGNSTAQSELDDFGTINGLLIAGGSVSVESGAVVSGASITLSGGALYISSGGTAFAETIANGGKLFLYGGGTAYGTTVTSGGALSVAGGTASGVTLDAGAVELVVAGGSIISTVLTPGTTAYLNSASALFTQVQSGAVLSNAGAGAGNTIWGGGTDLVADGGTESAATLSGGTQTILAGGTAINTVAQGAVISNAGLTISASIGTAAVEIISGPSNYVLSGGTAYDTTIATGGALILLPGALASGSTGPVYSTGVVFAAPGQFVSANPAGGTVIGAGMFEFVLNGGVAAATAVTAGGSQTFAGGIGLVTTVGSGGTEIVSAGTAYATTVSAGGQLIVAGGTADATTLDAGASLTMRAGTLSATTLYGAAETVSGGILAATVLAAGATLSVQGAAASGTQIRAGAQETLGVGATETGAVVSAGGTLYVSAYGTALSTTVLAGGALIGDNFSGTTVASGGIAILLPGDQGATNIALASGALLVDAGGSLGTVSGAGLVVSTGVVVQQAGAALALYAGGTLAANNGLTSGAHEYVLNAGQASNTVVSTGATLDLLGGAAFATQVARGGTVNDSAGILFLASIAGTVRDGGLYSANTYVAAGNVQSATITYGGVLELEPGGSVTGELTFAGRGGTLIDDQSTANGGTLTSLPLINGFQTGDTVVIPNAFQAAPILTNASGVITLADADGDTVQFAFNNAANAPFHLTADPAGGYDLSIACYATGTLILTRNGAIPIERLQPGDEVVTVLPAASRRIIWTGHRTIDLRRHPDPDAIRPVLIRAGALGAGLPERDLRVSPHHGIYLDGALFEAAGLVNGVTILRDHAARYVTYHHIELATHSLILAEGCPSETYLDTGNRDMFVEYDGPLQLHAVFRNADNAPACAPVIRIGSPVADGMRARLAGSGHARRKAQTAERLTHSANL